MNIPINDIYRLTSDTYNIVVERRAGTRTDRKTGNVVENWKPVAYAATVDGALTALERRVVRESGAKSIDALKRDVQRFRTAADAALGVSR